VSDSNPDIDGPEAPERDGKGRWKPGSTGNPGGYNRGGPKLRARLRRLLIENPERAQQAMLALLGKAEEGDISALKLLLDTADGLLALKIEGLSEEDIRERLVRVMTELRSRLPEEYHQAITDAARAAMLEDGDGDA
jgi:hypothetical protein